MGFNNSSGIYSLLRNHVSLHLDVHNRPLLFIVHRPSLILFQAIHQGYTSKDTEIVQKI
jgi:hypothetical protein